MAKAKSIREQPPVIAIVGLGWQGQALGHALQAVKTRYELVGHDREPARARAACDSGAVDRADWNLISAVEAADLVFLTEPLGQTLETLEAIAGELRPGSLVTDTAARKAPVLELAARVLPEGVSFIGGHPVLAPPPGAEPEADPERARAIFEGASWCLAPLPSASEPALQVLGRLIAAVGARAYYIDPQEHDALQAGVGLAPFLAAMALLRRLGQSPSADDLARLSGPGLLGMVDRPAEEVAGWLEATSADREGLAGWLDQSIAALTELRDAALGDAEAFARILAEAEDTRQRWLSPDEGPVAERSALDDIAEQSSLRHMLFGRLGRRETDEG